MTPFMIAITGGSGSGKSTLADACLAHFGADRCGIVGEDNYYLPRAGHAINVVGLEPAEVARLINFDDCASKDMARMREDIAGLKRGETIHQPVYSFDQHDRIDGATQIVAPREIILVEGIHVLSVPEIAELFDLRVFVDTPVDLRLARRVLRDIAPLPPEGDGRGRTPEDAINQYLTFVREAHQRLTEPAKYICDLVIADEGLPAYAAQSTKPSDVAIDRLLAPLLSRIRLERPDL